MSSEERNAFLSKIVGRDNALQVNSLFESKLLLKNQKAGYISWAKKVAGLTPEVRRDLIAKIERLDRVLSPKEGEQFLKDLAETRLGASVSETEAKNIFNLSERVKKTKSLQQENLTFKTEEQRLAYGRSKVALINYVNDLKGRTNQRITLNPVKALSTIAGNAKSIKASMDNSAIFRQGWKTLWTNPVIWSKNAVKSFSTIFKTFGGKKVMDELNADIISRPNYDLMVKAKLAIGTIEEAFPGTVAEKLPILGRVYKASENAFTGFVHKTRADVFDKYIQIAQKSGIELTEKELQSIGSMVNSLTGRGNLGRYEGSAANLINNVFFSPRFVKSQFDTLGHVISGAGGSNFVRKQAAFNLLKVVSGTATVLAIADTIKPGSVEWDSRSSDFGKIKIGNSRFDVTGGASSLVVLASRILPLLIGQAASTKSSITGAIIPINEGKYDPKTGEFVLKYGASTGKDVLFNFFSNKAAPVAGFFLNLLEGRNFNGEKPTLKGEVVNLFQPILFSTYEDLQKDPNSPNKVITMILDGLGIGVNTYLPKPSKENNWIDKPTISQNAFLKKVGEEKFKEANQVFNTRFETWKKEIESNEIYNKLSDDKKDGVRQSARQRIQDAIFKEYQFIYKEPKKTKEELRQEKELEKAKPKKVTQSLLDKLIPTAYAAEDNSLFGSATYKSDFKTGKTIVTINEGIINKIIKAVTGLFSNKSEEVKTESNKDYDKIKITYGKVTSNTATEEKSGETISIPKIPVSKEGEIDFKLFPNDQKSATRPNFTPPQPPQDIADIIKKHFGEDYATAVLVAVTENARYLSTKEADNIWNKDGSIDRGIFAINSNSFKGLMERQGNKLKAYDINSFEDMLDPDKNAYVAKLMRTESKQANPQTNGWGRWFGWQDTGYNINNGWYSKAERIEYEVNKKK